MSVVATPVSGPHAHKQTSVGRVMAIVMAGLVPATLYGFYAFGWPAIFLFAVTMASAVAAEWVCLAMAKKRAQVFLSDGSAILTAWLLAISLPPWAPWWIGCLGAVLAIVVGKQVFGGIGQNVFNPAMVGRVILLISFPLEMTRFHAPTPLFGETATSLMDSFKEGLSITFFGRLSDGGSLDAVSSASVLGHAKTELSRGLTLPEIEQSSQPLDMAMGAMTGSMGETSALLILAGGLFLLFMRITTWHVPVATLAALAAMAGVMHLIDPLHYVGPEIHLLSGATLLGAFFIATDPVTCPVSVKGRLIYGAGLGILIYVIRTWTGYPEGMAFAVLLMNAFAPLIDRAFKPRIYGRTRKGDPIEYPEN